MSEINLCAAASERIHLPPALEWGCCQPAYIETRVTRPESDGCSTWATEIVPTKLTPRSPCPASARDLVGTRSNFTSGDNPAMAVRQFRFPASVLHGTSSRSKRGRSSAGGAHASWRIATSASSPATVCQQCGRWAMFHELIFICGVNPMSGANAEPLSYGPVAPLFNYQPDCRRAPAGEAQAPHARLGRNPPWSCP